jgi:hypothetical protein
MRINQLAHRVVVSIYFGPGAATGDVVTERTSLLPRGS